VRAALVRDAVTTALPGWSVGVVRVDDDAPLRAAAAVGQAAVCCSWWTLISITDESSSTRTARS
jgi:hypothetical protein